MKEAHQIEITSYKEIWENMKEYYKDELEKHEKKRQSRRSKEQYFSNSGSQYYKIYKMRLMKNSKRYVESDFLTL